MKRLGPVSLLGVVLGYLAGCASNVGEQTPSQGQANLSGLPSLYAVAPQPPMFWSGDELRSVGEQQQQMAREGKMPAAGVPPWPVVSIPGQNLGIFSVGNVPYIRQKYASARPGNFSGLISHYPDADIHCTDTTTLICSSELHVLTSGGGRWVVNGEIQNRSFRV